MNLYELTKEWKELQDLLEECNADPTIAAADIQQAFSRINFERNKKLEGCLALYHNFNAQAEAISKEVARLKVLADRFEGKAEKIKNWVATNLQVTENFESTIGGFSWRKSEYLDSAPDAKLPKAYERVKIEPDKNLIKSALKAGKKIKGWFLAERINLQVK